MMKKLVIIALGLFLSTSIFAQEKQKEVGVIFNDFNSFGLTYRTGNTNGMWRFSTLAALGSSYDTKADSASRNQSGFTASLALGREFRKSIGNQLEFRYGLDLKYMHNSIESKNENYYYDWNYDNNGNLIAPTIVEGKTETSEVTNSIGVQLVLGVNYVVNEKLVFGIEINPAFMYTTGERENKEYSSDNEIQEYLGVRTFNANYQQTSDITRTEWRFNNGVGQVSILYRF
ncbi:hypothetical protein [Flammeovirga sp. EKP202]|uniref:hypothetical protein n=1 Tax=Flammeovirga sp. EKP202 TaxID=2770592 RepID=UPI00165F826C|nr:hypothetical protein [Flammeovirga sp. EKP202]MBD0401193.1 hypothetical protein [Flammeovirga sp. EKP202]